MREHPWGVVLVLAYIVLAVIYSIVNPIHEATDELRHYRYVRYIADYGQLPVQYEGPGNAQAHHPPLYYATAALLSFWVHPTDPLGEPLGNPHWGYRHWEIGTDNKNIYLHGPDEAWPYRDVALAAHLARWTTVLWGAAAVAVTYALARVAFPDNLGAAVTGTALVAFCPMFLYLGGAVGNDVPAGLMGAALTLVCLLTIRDGLDTRRTVTLGVLYGAAALTKFNLIAMLALIELTLIMAVWRHPRALQRFITANGIILGLATAIAGWWYVRNVILYGEPTGFLRLTEIWGSRDPRGSLYLALLEMRYAWTSLWARFGYGQIPLPGGYYTAMAVVTGLAMLGLAAFLWIKRQTVAWRLVALLVISALVNLAVLYAYVTVSPAGAMGRFFFPGFPAFAVLCGAGLTGLLPRRVRWGATAIVTLGMVGFALVGLMGYLAPAYAIPGTITLDNYPGLETGVPIGNAARILGYRVNTVELRPGDELAVTITWEVLQPTDVPYSVFVHLINPQGVIIAQRDTYTGLGTYPSQWWRTGHIFEETYRMVLPETTYAPDVATLGIGLYNPELGRLPIDDPNAQEDSLTLEQVEVLADPDASYPNPQFQNFEGRFALVGYEIEPRSVEPGGTVTVTLYWQALDPPDVNYNVFLHVISGWEARWAGDDGFPRSDPPTTRDWVPGQVYVDIRALSFGDDMPPGLYEVELGLFSDADGERLYIVAEDGHYIDDWILLNRLRVTEQ